MEVGTGISYLHVSTITVLTGFPKKKNQVNINDFRKV